MIINRAFQLAGAKFFICQVRMLKFLPAREIAEFSVFEKKAKNNSIYQYPPAKTSNNLIAA
jgi:hypothetical protein